MAAAETRDFNARDETRIPDKTTVELVKLAGKQIGHYTGWCRTVARPGPAPPTPSRFCLADDDVCDVVGNASVPRFAEADRRWECHGGSASGLDLRRVGQGDQEQAAPDVADGGQGHVAPEVLVVDGARIPDAEQQVER